MEWYEQKYEHIHQTKFNDYIRECIAKRRKINIKKLSADGIDVDYLIYSMYPAIYSIYFLDFVYSKHIIPDEKFGNIWSGICDDYYNNELKPENLTDEQKIVLDLIISFDDLANEDYIKYTDKIIAKMEKRYTPERRKRKTEKRIIDQLKLLSVKFPIAKHLIKAIRKYGCFSGKYYVNNIGISELKEFKDVIVDKSVVYTTNSYYDKNNNPVFVCVKTNGYCWCIRLREGKHFVLIVFELWGGEIVRIDTDRLHKNKDDFWKGKTVPERREEIYNLLNQKEGNKDEKC